MEDATLPNRDLSGLDANATVVLEQDLRRSSVVSADDGVFPDTTLGDLPAVKGDENADELSGNLSSRRQ